MTQQKKVKSPIKKTLINWFLVLSIMPMAALLWQNYIQTSQSIKKQATDDLVHATELMGTFVKNWFDYREMDIHTWSKERPNIIFMDSLSRSFKKSKLPLKEFVKSESYEQVTRVTKEALSHKAKTYDYIYDIFLIDTKGNLLYSVSQESDLATNLFTGTFSYTKFAKTVKETLKDGQIHFSDLEHYLPSNNELYGFMTAPLVSSQGKTLGVFAMQLKPDRIFKLFTATIKIEGIHHYLVARDGRLRSAYTDQDEILHRKIKTKQVKLFLDDDEEEGEYEYIDEDELVLRYEGPDGKEVYGLFYDINILGVHYALISEIQESVLLNSNIQLLTNSGIFVFLIALIVVFIALFVASRLTAPILKLSRAALQISNHESRQAVWVDTDNELAQLADAFNDMTEEVQANEKALKDRAQEMQNALHELKEQKLALDSHAIVSITDIEGTITYVNDKFCHVSGYTKEELLGENHKLLNSGEHSQGFWKKMYERVSQGNIWNAKVQNVAKDGSFYWVDTTILPFSNDEGIISSYISIRTDITEQREAHTRIEEALALNTSILESTDNGILVTDTKGAVLLSNQMFAQMWNIPNDLIQSKNDQDMIDYVLEQIVDPDAFSLEIMKAFEDKERVTHDLIKMKDGRMIERSSFPMKVSGIAKGRVWGFKDITEKEQFQQALIEAKNEAEQGALAKSEFLASMSHEIRTPMNGVLGMLSLLENSKLDQTQKHQANLAKSSAESLLTLINDILDFSKVEAGKLELDPVEFHLRDELGLFSEAIAFKAQEKDVELIFDVKDIERTLIVADAGRIRQILTNLIGNSIKFTSEGEILVTAVLTPKDKKSATLHFTVKDTGIGIPEDKIGDLFNSFTQVDASTTRKYGGTGLGLSIVKKLIELMNGSIEVTSVLGEGSTFSFDLEVGLSSHTALVMPSVNVAHKKVLIIDDNALNRMVVGEQLVHWGMEIFEAEDGKSALSLCEEYFKEHNSIYDIAIIDMQMPEMDGAELGKLLRKNSDFDSMKMVMMTSLGSRTDARAFADLGFDAFFPKPTTTNDLFHALNVLIEDKEALSTASPLLTKDTLNILKENSEKEQWHPKTRILLVEDNLTNQLVANGILDTFALKADIANNGQEALDILNDNHDKENPYTLVLMDCQMPILDGWKTTEAIREGQAGELYKDVPIVAMTANAMKGDKEACFDSGMNDYLAKPISGKTVGVMLEKWIQKNT